MPSSNKHIRNIEIEIQNKPRNSCSIDIDVEGKAIINNICQQHQQQQQRHQSHFVYRDGYVEAHEYIL